MNNNKLDLLQINHAGAMLLNNGITANYGVIRFERNKMIYYTGKGLREMWSPNLTDEQKIKAEELKKIGEQENGEDKLIDSGHIAVIALDQIERVLF